MEISEFCAVLVATLEGADWAGPLQQCRSLLAGIRTNPTHELSHPNQANTRSFLNDSFPEITRKLLGVQVAPAANCTEAQNFLLEAVSTIYTLTFSSVSYKSLLPLLADILDPAPLFYIYNGHSPTSVYSEHLLAIGKTFCESGQAIALLRVFPDPKFPLDDAVALSVLYNHLTQFMGDSKVFPDLNAAAVSFAARLNLYESMDQRQIPFSGIEKLVTNLATFCHAQPFIDELLAFIPILIDSALAELKMTGVTLCTILFNDVLTPAQLKAEDDMAVVYLTMWVKEIRNREGLSLIKPVLVKVAQQRGLGEEMVANLWFAVNEAPAADLPFALATFCDIVLPCGFPDLLKHIESPVRLEVYGRLLATAEYAESAAEFLLAQGTPQALAEVTKAARGGDPRFLLPLIMSLADDASSELLEGYLGVMDAIFACVPEDEPVDWLLHRVCEKFHEFANQREAFGALARLLKNARDLLQLEDFRVLFENEKIDRIALIRALFPAGGRELIDAPSIGFLDSEIARRPSQIPFGIVEHLFRNSQLQPLGKTVRDAV
jgi:hypothetical protein